jgi:hypothetical protein
MMYGLFTSQPTYFIWVSANRTLDVVICFELFPVNGQKS